MNCQQFDDRVQDLLDQRRDPRWDQKVLRHAEQCESCRKSLACYSALNVLSADRLSGKSKIPVRSGSLQRPMASSRLATGHSVSIGRTWKVASVLAAMLLILAGLTVFSNSPGTRFSTASTAEMAAGPFTGENMAIGPEFASRSAFDGLLVARLIPSRMPAWSDFSLDSISLEHIDLVALVPEHPASTVRALPATIQSIAPIYEYSSGIPVVNTWTSSVNYTLNLLKTNWKTHPAPAKPETDNGFGTSRGMTDNLLFA
jgi:hypothetical protein